MTERCTNPYHRGHKYYVGGIMDGQVDHLVYAQPGDYPKRVATLLRDGQRTHYQIDRHESHGTEVVYRAVRAARNLP